MKKAVTNDRSGPLVSGAAAGGGSSSGGPPLAKPPTLGAPPVPGAAAAAAAAASRQRSNSASNVGSGASTSTAPAAPQQLGGIFAAGMPKLRKRQGGVDTGGMFITRFPTRPRLTYGCHYSFTRLNLFVRFSCSPVTAGTPYPRKAHDTCNSIFARKQRSSKTTTTAHKETRLG